MEAKKPPAIKGAPPPENLLIAAVQRIVGSHSNDSRMPLDRVRILIERLVARANTPAEAKDNARLREHLESATGLTIAELAERTKRWPT